MAGMESFGQSNGKVRRISQKEKFRNLLNNNSEALVDNPLLNREPETLRKDVERFYQNHYDELFESVDLELLTRGALLARDEEAFLDSGDCSKVEKRALAKENKKNPQWSQQSKELKTVILTCTVAAITNGWTQVSIIGANLKWPREFDLPSVFINPDIRWSGSDTWKFGAVNSVTYFAASLLGAPISDFLNERFTGRRGAIFVSGLFTFSGSLAAAYTHNWQSLFACRLIQGIGYGAKAAVVPILLSEVSPSQLRGKILVSWQAGTALGLLLGSGANLAVNKSWRLQVGSCIIPSIALLFLAFIGCESPRWLIKKGKYKQGYDALTRLRDTPLQAARDLYYIHAQLQVETAMISDTPVLDLERNGYDEDSEDDSNPPKEYRTSYSRRVRQLFRLPRNRRAVIASCVVMVSQQFSGINVFAYLCASVLQNLNPGTNPGTRPLWVTFGFSAANAMFSPISYWFIETKGRRYLLLLSLICMVPLLLGMGCSFKILGNSQKIACLSVLIVAYAAVYSPGAGVIPFLYSSEIFPLVNREVGMSFAVTVNFALGGLIALTVPQMLAAFGHIGLLGFFAGLDSVAAVLVWLLMPSTLRFTTLEDNNCIFGVPMRKHMKYEAEKVLPWALNNYIVWPVKWLLGGLSRKPERPPPLYSWHVDKLKEEWRKEKAKTQENDKQDHDKAIDIGQVNQSEQKGSITRLESHHQRPPRKQTEENPNGRNPLKPRSLSEDRVVSNTSSDADQRVRMDGNTDSLVDARPIPEHFVLLDPRTGVRYRLQPVESGDD